MKKIALFVLTCCLLSCGIAHAESLRKYKPCRQEPPDKQWFYCKNNDSCILVEGVCGGDKALNKKYLTDWQEYSQVQPCRKTSPRYIGATVACVQKECVVIPPKKVKKINE